MYVIKHMQIHIIISDSFWRNSNVFYTFCKCVDDTIRKFSSRLLLIGSETQENKPINQLLAPVQYWHICCFHKKYISTTQSANLFWQMLWNCQIWGGAVLETIMQNCIIRDVKKNRNTTTEILWWISMFKNSSSGLCLGVSRQSVHQQSIFGSHGVVPGQL